MKRAGYLIALLVLATVSRLTGQGAATRPADSGPSPSRFANQIAPILDRYCVSCHSGDEPKGDTYLSFKDEDEARKVAKTDKGLWPDVVKMVSTKEMPPQRAPQKPTDAERTLLVNWINSELLGP